MIAGYPPLPPALPTTPGASWLEAREEIERRGLPLSGFPGQGPHDRLLERLRHILPRRVNGRWLLTGT